jgi:hypothetical protein
MKSIIVFVKALFRNAYVLMFLNGFLIATVLCFRMQASYEDGVFASIKSSIGENIDPDDNADSIAVKSMNLCYSMMRPRASTFRTGTQNMGPEANLFHSTSIDLQTTSGACGSYSQVLARILKSWHYPVRIAQMKAYGYFGGHMIVEVFAGSHWVVLDPTFNLAFTRPDGRLASFQDVHSDWNYYSQQVPADYDKNYKYEDARYTNWDKVPVLFPAIKKVMTICMGTEEANSFSMRTHFMNTYMVWYNVLLILEIGIFLMTVKRMVKTRSISFSRYFDVRLRQNKIQ